MKRRDVLTSGLALAAGTVAAPAVVKAQTTFSWKMTSFYGPNAFFYSTGPGSAKDLIKRIDDMSSGRLKIQFYGAGELIPAAAGFDAVSSGTVEMNYANSYFWTGKTFAGQYFCAVPFGMNFVGLNGWMYDGGGLELWREVYDKFNLVPFLCGNTGVQMGGWFNKEIESPDDFKGLKMRIPGDGGDVLAKLGASPVSLPGGQIYENLVSGAIDATEWVGPFNDYFMKFYEAAKYYYWPGMHEPGSQLTMGMNASWWGGLSPTIQAIIVAAAAEENAKTMAETNANNGEYLKKLTTEHGVQLREFNDDVYDAMGDAAQEVFESARSHSELSARIYDSVAAARQDVG